MNINKLFEENNIDKVHFYNVKTPIDNNSFTVCVLFNSAENRIEARGISICSVLDSYKISKGKNKSLGRALKALKRKKNFFKINGAGRKNEFVTREMKIKDEIDEERFQKQIVPELKASSTDLDIKVVSDPNNSRYSKKYIFKIPLSYPVQVANRYFRYKSQYRPTPIGRYELDLFKPTVVEV